jgi:hypothetical protein
MLKEVVRWRCIVDAGILRNSAIVAGPTAIYHEDAFNEDKVKY